MSEKLIISNCQFSKHVLLNEDEEVDKNEYAHFSNIYYGVVKQWVRVDKACFSKYCLVKTHISADSIFFRIGSAYLADVIKPLGKFKVDLTQVIYIFNHGYLTLYCNAMNFKNW